ncbi:hypothetical protein TrCOL_g2364 [Triparma columacea]|uniref:FAD-binding PCMH-type domain-containing protein n=1 Tax=Triparma columacea TaxID=722753 RepID=A0A9W7LCF8_9STRA|nr:hypothetical protein TrCOL_g2364 [Triparma columacea]
MASFIDFPDALKCGLPMLTAEGAMAAEYAAEMKDIWNQDLCTRRPAFIVQPKSAADVQSILKAYKAAPEPRPPLAVACGRHSARGFVDGALVVDLSKWKSVSVDATSKTVTVEGGAKLGDMDAELSKHGLAVCTGTNPDTGVIGLSIVGGGGFLARLHGLAVDNFVEATVCTAEGELVKCSDSENTDLFWGIRGGGGHFGIIVSLTMRAHSLTNLAVVEHPTFCRKAEPQTKEMLERWGAWAQEAPNEVGGLMVVPCGAPVNVIFCVSANASVVPQEKLKKKSVGSSSSFFKNPMKWSDIPGLCDLENDTFGGSFRIGGKNLRLMDYHAGAQTYLVPHQKPGHFYEAAFMLPTMTPEAAGVMARMTKTNIAPNGKCALLVFMFGGKASEASNEATAIESRDYRYWVIVEGSWEYSKDKAVNDARKAAVAEWTRKVRLELAPHGLKESPHVFEGEDEEGGTGLRKAFVDSNIDRLLALKHKYDPQNTFPFNKILNKEDSEGKKE